MQQPGNPDNIRARQQAEQQNKAAIVQPDPETLHTTDPQDEMRGPVSSLMQEMKETFDTDEEPKKKDDDVIADDEE